MEKVQAKEVIEKIMTFFEEAKSDAIIRFTDISNEVADLIFFYMDERGIERGKLSYNEEKKLLRIILPGYLHDSVAGSIAKVLPTWAQLLPPNWETDIFIATTPLSSGFLGRRRRTKKEPDLCFYPTGQSQPSVLLEAADTETYTEVLEDKDTWIYHTNGSVKVVIIVKWYRRIGGVSGFLELWRSTGSHRYELFPVPAQPVQDPTITIDELYGGSTPAGSNAQTALPLSLDIIRSNARMALRLMGLTEAL